MKSKYSSRMQWEFVSSRGWSKAFSFFAGGPEAERHQSRIQTSEVTGDHRQIGVMVHLMSNRQTNMKPSQNKSSGRQQRKSAAGHVSGSAAADFSSLLCCVAADLHDPMTPCSLLLFCLGSTLIWDFFGLFLNRERVEL